MKKLLVVLACLGLVASGLTTAAAVAGPSPAGVSSENAAGPSPGGVSSDNLEWLTTVPFNGPTATGANFFKSGGDHYMIVTGWHNFAIYDINDPEAPALVGNPVPFGFQFENEDVSTNGRIMLFSETLPNSDLHVWDIEDKANPILLASVVGAGDHTSQCILNCTWAYGSEGTITDLRDPANPVLMDEKWTDGQPPLGSTHDVTEVAPGIVLTSTDPMLLLDARDDPLHPKMLAASQPYEGNGLPFHSNLWPREMKDRFIIAGGETCCGAEQCTEETAASFMTWDAKDWEKTGSFKLIDEWWAYQGTVVDGGNPASAPFGCSPHWFTTQPGTWNDGGIVAVGWYNSGTRLLEVNSQGKIKEIGWFLPAAGGTSGAYFVNKEIIYAVDYQRGIDVLRFTGSGDGGGGGGGGGGGDDKRPRVKMAAKPYRPQRGGNFSMVVRLAACERDNLNPAGTKVHLKQKKSGSYKTVATKTFDKTCRVLFPRKANFNSAKFRAFWPKQKAGYTAGRSQEIVVNTRG